MHRFININVLIILFLFTASMGLARDYIIYSIVQDIPMGIQQEVIKKNYYINIGTKQGLDTGATLDVYRTISRLDPYENKQRYNYNVKIGELEVLHAEDEASIAQLGMLRNDKGTPLFEINDFMIGDHVKVQVK